MKQLQTLTAALCEFVKQIESTDMRVAITATTLS
jgi:hypothetical protein